MRTKLFIVIYFVLIGGSLFSQSSGIIKGRVSDAATGSPVANCSVFINSTSKGTKTNTSGNFEIINVPAGKYELIVSSIGYETYVYTFTGNQLPLDLTIKLNLKAIDLSEVTVEPFLKDGWEAWGQTFLDNFIGTTVYAKECTLTNRQAVHFRFSKKKNILTATADEPLVIENRALGYTISFQLEEFTADFNSQTNIYLGYPLFHDISPASKAEEIEWRDRRKKSYLGSITHFMRSLYDNSIKVSTEFNQEGFDVRKRVLMPNAEKLRVREIYKVQPQSGESTWPEDSLKYFKKVMKQPDSSAYNKVLTAADLVSVVSSNNEQTKSLFFRDKISVTYRRKRKLDTEVQKSTVYLVTPAPVQIEENGYYDSPLEFFTIGYWATYQKLANILPLDYWPEDE